MCLWNLITVGGKLPRSVWSCAMLTPPSAVSFSKSLSCSQEWEKVSCPLYCWIKAAQIHKCLCTRQSSIPNPTVPKKTATTLLKYFAFLVLNIKSFGLCNAKIGMKRREENRIGAQFRLSLNLHLSHTIVQIFSNISQCFCLCNKNKWGPMQCYFKIIYILL